MPKARISSCWAKMPATQIIVPIQYIASNESSIKGYHEFWNYNGSTFTKLMELRPTALEVLVNADFNGTLNVDGTLNVEGATVIDDTLNVTGKAGILTLPSTSTVTPTWMVRSTLMDSLHCV